MLQRVGSLREVRCCKQHPPGPVQQGGDGKVGRCGRGGWGDDTNDAVFVKCRSLGERDLEVVTYCNK